MVIVRLRKLKCPLCGSRDLEVKGEDVYKCKFCGLSFTVIDECDGMLVVYIGDTYVQYHHVVGSAGEEAIIKCPYCGRSIYLWLRAQESDTDMIDVVVAKGGDEVLKKIEAVSEDEDIEEDLNSA